MKDRLEVFLQSEGLTKAQFADSINLARASISHIMAGRNNPSYEFIVNTMNTYRNLNIEWLLTGHGSMYKSDSPAAQPEVDSLFAARDIIPTLSKTLNTPEPAQIKPEPSQIRQEPASLHNLKTGISRIVVFFSDGTYKEFC